MSVVLGVFVVALGAYVALRSPSPSSAALASAGAVEAITVDQAVASVRDETATPEEEPDAELLQEPEASPTAEALPAATVESVEPGPVEPVAAKTVKRRTKRARRKPRPKAKPQARVASTSPSAKEGSTLPVECVLDPRACGKGGTPGLAAKPSASQIRKAIAKLEPEAKRCGTDHGLDTGDKVRIKLSVEGASGRVTSAKALGDHAGTAAGRCVARVFSRATMPRFSKSSVGILYSARM